MPAGQLVASSYNTGNSAGERLNGGRRIFVASNGQRIAILEDASNNLKYSTSADGVTWSAVASLYAPGSSRAYGGMLYLSDVLYVFTVDGSNNLRLLKWAYTTGTNSFGSVTEYSGLAALGAQVAPDATWDSTHSVFYVATKHTTGGASTDLGMYTVTTTGSCTPQIGQAASNPTPAGLQVVPGATSIITACYIDAPPGSAGPLYLFSATFDGTTWTPVSLEVISSGFVYAAGSALDNSNNRDIVYIDSSYKLQAVKRTGTNVYSTPANIASGSSSSFPSVTLTPDGSGGLLVWYSSVAGRTQGEIYVVHRKSGLWSSAALFKGGDASGYEVPRSSPSPVSNRVDVLYEVGTISPFDVYYGAFNLGSAPNTPTNVTPNGFVTTLTPPLSALYTNGTVTDQSSAVEWRVIRTSDSFVMWDSGAISQTVNSGSNLTGTYGAGSNVGDPNYVGPTALSFGVQYQIQARAWDSILLPTQVSSYSTPVTFTPVHGGTVAITSLTSGGSVAGTSSPVTITAPDVQPTASWTQADGHTADKYQIYVYQADGITLITTTGALALSPALATGNSVQLADFSVLSLQNSSTYILVVALRDATSLAWSQSPPWTLHTNWAPPGNPTGVTATPVPTGGCYDQVAWTNGSNTNSVNVYRKLTGSSPSTAILLSTGLLITAIKDLAPLNTAFDYGIQGVGTLGGTTGIVWAAPCTLGLANGNRGFVFNDLTNPLTVWAPLGVSPSGSSDWTTMTNWQLIQQQQIAIPEGRTRYIRDSGKAQAWTAPGRQWEVLDVDTMSGVTLLANAYAMVYATASPTLYRDPYGDYRYVLLSGPAEKRYGPASRTLTIDMSEADAVYAPVVA